MSFGILFTKLRNLASKLEYQLKLQTLVVFVTLRYALYMIVLKLIHDYSANLTK